MSYHELDSGATTILGETATRPPARRFGIKESDRAFHLHVIGKTGTGKSTLLLRLMQEDLKAGRGLTFIDPHGDAARRVATLAEKAGRKDVIYLDASSPAYGYNPLKAVAPRFIPLAVSGLLEVFKKRFPDAWGVRMEHVLRNALYAILDTGGGTLQDVLRLFSDREYQEDLAKRIKNDVVREFWQVEFANQSDRYKGEAAGPIQNKISAFLADPSMRKIVTTKDHQISFRKVMDEGSVLIVNLARGTAGEDSSSLLGAMLLTSIALAAYSRDKIPEESRRRHYLYVDEFQAFTTLSVADMISELRKYRLSLVLAHQHFHQLDESVRHAIIGNTGTVLAFRVGGEDAVLLAREFAGKIPQEDLVTLANHTAYLRLMIDGEPSSPFRITTLPLGDN